jgi:hypothetical protein
MLLGDMAPDDDMWLRQVHIIGCERIGAGVEVGEDICLIVFVSFRARIVCNF